MAARPTEPTPIVDAEGRPLEVFRTTWNETTREVTIHTHHTPVDWRKITPRPLWVKLIWCVFQFRGQMAAWYGATCLGGGVALMRKPQLALLQMLAWVIDQIPDEVLEGVTEESLALLVDAEIDVLMETDGFDRYQAEMATTALGIKPRSSADFRWYVLAPDKAAALVTKGWIHNGLQGTEQPGTVFTQKEKDTVYDWIRREAAPLAEPLSTATITVIDDCQPSGLGPYIKGPFIYRNHIQNLGPQTGTPGTLPYDIVQWVMHENQMNRARATVFHPIHDFVFAGIPDRKVVFLPATFEMLEHMPLSDEVMKACVAYINKRLAKNGGQNPLRFARGTCRKLTRPVITIVARYCPAKYQELVIRAYAQARQEWLDAGKPLSQFPILVVAGMYSVDDTDGEWVLPMVMELRDTVCAEFKNDVKVVQLDSERCMTAIIALAMLGLQPSKREGFESRASEYIWWLVYVLVSNMGGLPIQMVDGVTGRVLSVTSADAVEVWAKAIVEYVDNPKVSDQDQALRGRVFNDLNFWFTTVPNCVAWLYLMGEVLNNNDFAGNRQWVTDMAGFTDFGETLRGVSHAPQSATTR